MLLCDFYAFRQSPVPKIWAKLLFSLQDNDGQRWYSAGYPGLQTESFWGEDVHSVLSPSNARLW